MVLLRLTDGDKSTVYFCIVDSRLESLMMSDPASVEVIISALKEMGCEGSGPSPTSVMPFELTLSDEGELSVFASTTEFDVPVLPDEEGAAIIVCNPSDSLPPSLRDLSLQETGAENNTITLDDTASGVDEEASFNKTVKADGNPDSKLMRSYEPSHQSDTELRSPPSKVMRRKEEPSTTCQAPCQDTSPFVVIWGLEDTSELVKEHFIRYVKRKLITKNFVPKTIEHVINDVVVAPDHVIVEFCSVKLAQDFVSMSNLFGLTYDDQPFVCEPHLPPKPVIHMSSFAKCLGLADDFIKEHFLRFIEKQAQELDVVPHGVCRAALKCVQVNSEVYVEFASVEVAEKMCVYSEILVLEYDDEAVKMVQLSTDKLQQLNLLTSTETPLPQIPDTPFLLFNNLPEDFMEPHFIRHLNKKGRSLGLAEGNPIVMHVSNFSCTDNSIEIKFISSDVAAQICAAIKADKWMYEGNPLSAEMLSKTNESADSSAPSSSQKLSEYEENVLFLKALLRLRHMFTGRNHEAGYARMHVDLMNQGLKWDISTLTKKRRSFLDMYKKRGKTNRLDAWEFQKPLSVILGLKDEEILAGTEFSTDERSPAVDLASFTKGAVFTDSAIKYLISICVLNKKEFQTDTCTQTSVWNGISKIMHEKKYYYDGTQCERKMISLKAMYREEAKRRECKTGAETLEVPFFEEMRALMEDDFTVHPKKTMAAGVATEVTLVREEDENADEPAALGGTQRRGITRAPTLKRPRPLNERKVVAFEQIASALATKYSPERE